MQSEQPAVFKASWRTSAASRSAWAITIVYSALIIIGGYMIHPGLGLLGVAYCGRQAAAALTELSAILLRRDAYQFQAAEQERMMRAAGMTGGSDIEQHIEREMTRINQQRRAAH